MSVTAVVAERIVLAYGKHIAIDESSFTVPAGSVTAVIGPNGAGKSTILNGIAGLMRPVRGSLHLSGIGDDRRRIAYVLQTTKVNEALPISVREVVTMGRYASVGWHGRLTAADRAAAAAAMDKMGITDIQTRHLRELSGGQRQRVFVAQGLAQDHDLLLLDEPLTGIDLPTARAIDAVIHDEVAAGGTVIMTTHDLSEAAVADHVLLISGRVVAEGRPDDALTVASLTEAYGTTLLHVGDEGGVFVDDPAHAPVAGRHLHRHRTIHTESSPTDLHGE
ncbi:MAG: metal ABC transporter ATP-binding protein [Acidimicrobiia bacterium]